MTIKRGDVWLARLGLVEGSEQAGTRPVVVIQNDIGNRFAPTTVVAAVSSSPSVKARVVNVSTGPAEGGLARESRVMLSQIRTLDKRRLIKRLGALSPETMAKVDEALKISLGLVPLE